MTASLLGVAAGGPAAADEHEGTSLRVNADGVAFDGRQVQRGAQLEYTVRPLENQNATYLARVLGGDELRAGWAPFHEARGQFPDGYCVMWLRLDRSEWGEWMEGRPVCWEPEGSASGSGDEAKQAEPPEPTEAAPEPTRTQETRASAEDAAPARRADRDAAPATPDPTPTTPSPTPSPTPSAGPSSTRSPSPSPSLSSDRSNPAEGIVRSFAGETPAADNRFGPPDLGGLTWLWVLIGGIGAAAGGVLIMMRRGM